MAAKKVQKRPIHPGLFLQRPCAKLTAETSDPDPVRSPSPEVRSPKSGSPESESPVKKKKKKNRIFFLKKVLFSNGVCGL